jgi:amino acid permease
MRADWKTIVTILLLVLLLGTAVSYLIVLHNDLTVARRDMATLHDDAAALHEDMSVVKDVLEPWLPGN